MADRDTSPTSTSSMMSNIIVHAHKEPASRSSSTASPPTSTPPTSLGDETSILSEVGKMELATEIHEELSTPQPSAITPTVPQSAPDAPDSEGRRSARSSRRSVTTYNVQILAGTAIHTPTKYLEKHHKNVVHGDLEKLKKANPASSPKRRSMRPKMELDDLSDPVEQQLATEAAQAAQRRRTSSRFSDLRREALRNVSGVGEAVAHTLAGGKALAQSVLRRSASDSRLRSSTQTTASASSKRARAARYADTDDEDSEEEDEEEEEEKEYVKPKTKQWMKQGLYVGQDRGFNARLSESQNRARRKSRQIKENKVLPLPMFAADRMLDGDPRTNNRPFKLPYDVYNPLPRKVKVDGWVKLHKNRFIGEASALWKRDKQDTSQCYCTPEDGCGEACHNRIMAYECDATNCPLTANQCNNRPFAQLKKRAKGNGYDYGVEVTSTEGKGYGVRAMRTFEPHQIIVEYAGEIITQDECERRMKQVYKKDKCYYLMSFDNKMIIDATRGTIARFVNHSCEPNCEMIKWTVGGEPRMALFAGSRGIMTGEELTYDYNFDPFSSKNIQECRCGTRSCRGVLGPKPKKPAVEEKSLASTILAGTKRKLQEVFGSGRGSESAPNSPRKRHMGNSAMTKAKNAQALTDAARDKAQKDAAAHAAQIASRKDRALQRSKSLTMSRRSKMLRKATRGSASGLKSSRHTTVSISRKVSKPGALKPVRRIATTSARNAAASRGRKGIRPARASKAAAPPERSATPSSSSSSDDESPNITPASLRSANKKKTLTQTKLPFKPLRLNKDSTARNSSPSPKPESMSVPDTEDEEEEHEAVGRRFAKEKFPGKKRGSAVAPRGLHKTGAGVSKVEGRGLGRVRNARGRFEPKGKGKGRAK